MDPSAVNFQNGLVQIALVSAMTGVLKAAICGGDPKLEDRYARAIAVVVGVLWAVLGAPRDMDPGMVIGLGLVNGLIACGAYKAVKVGLQAVPSRPDRTEPS